jgi:hypothetical protein
MPSVLQPWLENIPIKMQSTLILGLRGPDTHSSPGVKSIVRWMRGLAFKPGRIDNLHEFMTALPENIAEKSATYKELEFCTQHFYGHLLHALEVVAYRYPDPTVACRAMDLVESLCAFFHLPVETEKHFEGRLKDEEWPEGQPTNYEEARKQLMRCGMG